MAAREWLRQIRHSRGLTQEEVSQGAGIHRAFYTQIETGVRNPSVKTSKSIAEVLGIEWTIFFGENCGVTPQKKGEILDDHSKAG